MAVYGYHRTSTKEQHLDRGIIEIQNFCREHHLELIDIFTDQMTGKKFDRPEYQFLKKRICLGDMLIITELDRLGRNKLGILKELRYFQEKGVRVMVLELPTTLIDLSKFSNELARMMIETINNMMIELYVSMADAEMKKKEKRQREGYETKHMRGEWDEIRRPAVMGWELFYQYFEKVVAGEITPTELRRELNMTHSTFYRYRNMYYKKYVKKFQSED